MAADSMSYDSHWGGTAVPVHLNIPPIPPPLPRSASVWTAPSPVGADIHLTINKHTIKVTHTNTTVPTHMHMPECLVSVFSSVEQGKEKRNGVHVLASGKCSGDEVDIGTHACAHMYHTHHC